MKFLFITFEALSADLAWQLKKEGHEVKFYCHDQPEKDVGNGFFDKVDEWEPHKDWADVIVFDDIGFGSKADQLRNEGKHVVGGSNYTDKLELDREFGQAELKLGEVNTLPSWNFTSFDEAVAFVKANPERYVIKPSGKAQDEKELLFIGQEEDGKDVIQVLEHYKENWSKKIKEFQIQKFAEGVEIAVGAFFNGKDFILPINVNFEHKRLFPTELGPSTGEMGTSIYWTRSNPVFESTLLKMKDKLAASRYVGYIDINCIVNSKGIWPLEWTCFDEETEILTRGGWKRHDEVVIGDYALSMNPSNRELAWKRVVNKMERQYEGKMITFGADAKSHTAMEALVTPEHKMLISHAGVLKLVRADSIPIHDTKIVRTGSFKGEEIAAILIAGYAETHYLGRQGTAMQIEHAPITVPASAFMGFLGLYLAEGSLGGRPHFVSIAQSSHSRRRPGIRKILDACGFDYSEEKNGAFQISSTQLVKFIQSMNLGEACAAEKFVPPAYKDLAPEHLEALIAGFALGDGNRHRRTGQLTMGTTSKGLADDLQELIIKCGKVANVRIQRQAGTEGIGGHERHYDIHVISVREKKTDYSIDKRVIRTPYYKGLVWDVEVEEWHTMLVRRKGKPYFSGNCRFGYPTISIHMEGITSEWGSFLSDLAQGKDAQLKAKKGYQVGVVVAIPPWPFQDDKAFRKYSEGASILFRRQSLDGIHIGEVKLEEGDWHIAGNSGYALVVTGSGATMSDAIRQAYQNVRNVMIPNMFYRTDIGQRWMHDSDKLLSWGYL